MKRGLCAGLLYFAWVFGAGTVLGTLRVLWLAPFVGARTAELLEMPLMFAISVAAAWWIVQHMALSLGQRIATGVLALALVLACEFTVVLYARGLTVERYLATFDPVSGTLYYALLLVFMLLPMWFHPRYPKESADAAC
jgi:hypothetical protein